MATGYAEAVAALFQSPLDQFVAERKRLSSELKAAGEKADAARLGKLARPPLSAWAVNQLWWQVRAEFEQLFAAAERLRAGELAAAGAHREVLAKLRARTAAMLVDAGHAATEATLRRVTATLSALAANGGFDPDPPGALVADRDPPGFDAAAGMFQASLGASADRAAPAERGAPPPEAPAHRDTAAEAKAQREAEAAEAQHLREVREAKEAAERLARERREAEERARKLAERKQLESQLAEARSRAERGSHEIERLRAALAQAEAELARSQSALADLTARLASLDPPA